MRTTTAVIVTSFIALTVDARHHGILTSFEQRHLAQPAPAPRVLRRATLLGERRVAGPVILVAMTSSSVGGRKLLLCRVVRVAVTVGGRALLAQLVGRPRPPQTWWQETPSGFSFPSRHVTWAALAIDEAVRSLPEASRRWATVGEVGLIGSVGISRVRLGVHWPTDVIAALLWTGGLHARDNMVRFSYRCIQEVRVTAPLVEVAGVEALEILDSRGNPTVVVSLTDPSGRRYQASVPSGASTGRREAKELRDGDVDRFGGLGVLGAVAAVQGSIRDLLCGQTWHSLDDLDSALRSLDGTPDLSRLGANAVLGVSVAMCRAFAATESLELHDWIEAHGLQVSAQRLPVPHFNVVNGGAHAANGLPFQEFMIAPVGAPDLPSAVRAGAEVYHALKKRLAAGGHATGLGDEGGFAPALSDPAEVLELLTQAIGDAGYPASREGVMLAMDPAANGFFEDGHYQVDDAALTPVELVALYTELIGRFPLWSIEDGCAEDDEEGWQLLTSTLGETIQLVTDDNACTQAQIVRELSSAGIGNAVLIKPNQVGTVSDMLETVATAETLGYSRMVSHRSGETTDDFVADLSVGIGCGELKSGAPARGERVAKYNRLLTIAAARPDLPYGLVTAPR